MLCFGSDVVLWKNLDVTQSLFVFLPRRARERMIELSRTRDGGKEEGMEGWREASFMSYGFKEGREGAGTEGGDGGKQLECPPTPSPPPPPPPNLMDSISGEFALVINGHSLVKTTDTAVKTRLPRIEMSTVRKS